MDDLSPELRGLVESARDQALTRAAKARLWRGVEGAVAEERARSKLARVLSRARFSPALVRYAAAALCLAGLTLTIDQAVDERDPVLAPVARVASAQPGADLPSSEPPTPNAVEPPSSKHASKSARTAARARRARAAREEESAVLAAPDAATLRLRPARAQLLLAKANGESTPPEPGREEPARTGRRPSAETEQVLANLEAFREKLVAENYARYQAALAEHARTASVRRGPPSVGGYSAW